MARQEACGSIGKRIDAMALDLLKQNPDGIRYGELRRKLAQEGGFNINFAGGKIWNLDQRFPNEVYKPSRGLLRLMEFRDQDSDELRQDLIPQQSTVIREEAFYASFADWLQNDLEECTKAVALGGSRFKDKWGTPDVIGKRESKKSDILQAPVEIVSAEIKIGDAQLVTAFGLACAYRLFSHKSYLVVPSSTPQDEVARLDALCRVFGIGLILFDARSPETPNFEIRVRALKQEPDMFYVNKYMILN